MAKKINHFIKSMSLTLVLSVLVSLVNPIAISANSKAITITEESIVGTTAKISGNIPIDEKAYLNINVKKNDTDFYTEDFQTDKSGAFSVAFHIDAPGDERQTYSYTISEKLPEDTITSIHTQDFSSALPTYVANTGVVDAEVGNDAPSYKIESKKRLLFQSPSAIESGIYTVEADVYFPEQPTINGNIFMTTNSAGNSTLAKSINTANVSYAYVAEVNSGALRIRYCDNATEQTTVSYGTVLSSIEKNTWYNLKIKMNLDTYKLEVFLNGEKVLTDTDMYIFAHRNYTRLFDTGNSDRSITIIDNLKINNIIEGKLCGIDTINDALIQYGTVDYNQAKLAVNEADADTIDDVLNMQKDVLGIDMSKYNNFDMEDKNTVKSDIISRDYEEVSQIKEAFEKVCAFVELKHASENKLSEKIQENKTVFGLNLSDGFFADTDIIHCIYANLTNMSDFDALKKLISESSDLYQLKEIKPENLAQANGFMEDYGYNVNYDACNDSIKSALENCANNFEFDFDAAPQDTLKSWAQAMNITYKNARIESFDYVISVDEYAVSNNVITVSGTVVPEIKYDFIAVASVGDVEKGRTLFTTDQNGKFNCNITVPLSDDDIEYSVKIEAVVPEENPEYLFKEYFDGTQNNNYTVNTGIDIAENVGNPVPSLKLSKEEDEKSARQLAIIPEINSMTEGLLCIQASFMKPENSVSVIYRIANATGNVNAITISSTNEGKINLTYLNASNIITTKELIGAENFEINQWYALSVKINVGSKMATVGIDDHVFSFQIGSNINDFSRAYDTIATTSGIHYIDNVVIYRDKAERINASDENLNITVYGKNAINAAVNAVKTATALTMEDVLHNYNAILKLDFEDFDSLTQKGTVLSALMNNDAYSEVQEICRDFYSETALQKMKEETDHKKKAEIFAKYSSNIGVNRDDILIDNSVYLSYLNANLASVESVTALKTMAPKLTLVAKMMSATQFTIKSIVDSNLTTLKNLGLKNQYDNLNESQKKTVVGAVFNVSTELTDIDAVLTEIVQCMNKAIDAANSAASANTGGTKGSASAGGSIGGGGSGLITKVDGTSQAVIPQLLKTFEDVDTSHWGFEAVEYLAKKGIINGKDNHCFEPEATVKREEFVKMIVNALGVNTDESEVCFEDVSNDSWFAAYVAAAVKLGIVNGISDTLFGAGTDITRQDAVTLLYRCRNSLNSGLIAAREYSAFGDSAQIDAYAVLAVEHFYKCNVVNGDEENNFAPLDNLTRAEAAKLIYEIIRR